MEVIHKLVDNQMIEHMSFASMEVLRGLCIKCVRQKRRGL